MYFLASARKHMSLHHTKNSAVDSKHVVLPSHMGESAWELGMPCFEWLTVPSWEGALGDS